MRGSGGRTVHPVRAGGAMRGWSCRVVRHLPSGLPGHWWSACQEPLILNTELDLTDKLSRCCRPMASLAGERRVTSFLRRPRQQRVERRKTRMAKSSGSFQTSLVRNHCRPPALEAKGLTCCWFCCHSDISYK